MEFETWWSDQISGAPTMAFNTDEGLAKAAWEAALKNNTVIDCRLCLNFSSKIGLCGRCASTVRCIDGNQFKKSMARECWRLPFWPNKNEDE